MAPFIIKVKIFFFPKEELLLAAQNSSDYPY